MRRTTRFSLAVVVGLLAVTIPAFAQTALGTLRGVVRDQQGGALPGVTLTVRQVDTNTATVAVTGAEGQFFLPNLRVKQDVVPGMKQYVWFQANKSGVYDIVCAELCGWGHYKMRGRLTVEPRDTYDAWLAQQSAEQNRAGFTPSPGAAE